MKNKGPLYVLTCYVIWGLLPIFWKLLAQVDSLYVAFNRQGYCVAALSERRRDATGIGNIALKMEEPPYQQSQGEPLLKRCLFQRQNVLFRLVPRVFRQVVAGGLAAGKLIAAFVLGMAVVPAHPFQRDAVAVELDLQALPDGTFPVRIYSYRRG